MRRRGILLQRVGCTFHVCRYKKAFVAHCGAWVHECQHPSQVGPLWSDMPSLHEATFSIGDVAPKMSDRKAPIDALMCLITLVETGVVVISFLAGYLLRHRPIVQQHLSNISCVLIRVPGLVALFWVWKARQAA
jgi:hypothetical protein